MEIIKLNKKQLENLQPLELDKKIFNTEAQIFKLNEKNNGLEIQNYLKNYTLMMERYLVIS